MVREYKKHYKRIAVVTHYNIIRFSLAKEFNERTHSSAAVRIAVRLIVISPLESLSMNAAPDSNLLMGRRFSYFYRRGGSNAIKINP